MKILQISFHTSPFGNIGKFDSGGLNVYVQQISKQLSKNHNVTVVTAEKAESFKNGNLEFHSLNMFDPDLSTEDKEIHLKSFRLQLEKTIDLNSFDIIHAHYWLSGLVAKQISDELNIPFIFTSHSLGVFLEGYNKERVDCEKIIMTGCNFVTSSSNFENTLISENYNIYINKIKKIKPGINREIFSPDLTLKRENIFLSVGRIQKQKRQLKTISFLNNFKKIENDFVCYFVGGPSGKSGNDYFQELKKSVTDLKLESHVEFLGDLPQYEIKELLNKSKLLIHSSQFETFGLVAIEANSMGVPVLTSNNGPLKEIIENNINGYCSEDLIDGKVNMFVKNLINDDLIYGKIMNSCVQKSTNYSWENTSNELLNLYQEAKLS
tara:strand:- start:335 stop:1474 length:1140 start_codon:yes stop_codon:yes gene_type:complete